MGTLIQLFIFYSVTGCYHCCL